MSSKKPERQRRNKAKQRREARARGTMSRTEVRAEEWQDNRSGAVAARGFQFQHTAGAWLAAQIADGTIDGTLVPEGLDDLVIEAVDSTNVQIKSRRPDLGPFPPYEAAAHITDAWLKSQDLRQPPARQWVILEGRVASSEDFDDLSRPLAATLAWDSPLFKALVRRVPKHLTEDQLAELLEQTYLSCATWDELAQATDTHLSATPPAQDPAGRHLVHRSLLVEIATVTAANADPDIDRRRSLTRGELQHLITTTAELLDISGLNEAISSGLCFPLDWTTGSTSGDRFYEGESTQPGHVTAGLVVPRPDLVDLVLAATNDNRPVLLNGPSGVGKSAVLWTVPSAALGVTWFRVERLETDDDANLLMRLARSYGATRERPVGFLIDGAGAGQVTGWAHARTRAAGDDGVILVGTVRNEDLIQLGALADTVTIEVRLDESSAATIFDGLQRRGVTTEPHWAGAFELANGLTLEFTHLLTRGQRLRDVIDDQIRHRIAGDRTDELDLLALVALAHQWGATLEVNRVTQVLGHSGTQLRKPIQRLVDEHLLVETDGILTGLHAVRSTAITSSIHATPPPTAADTLRSVLAAVDDRQIPILVASALREDPTLAEVIIDVAATELESARRLAGFLQGLRLSDAEDAIRVWADIITAEGVKRATHLTVAMLAIAGSDMGDITPDTIRASLERIADVPAGVLRDRLADLIGTDALAQLIVVSSPTDATMLVATLQGWACQLQLPPDAASSRFVAAIADLPLDELTEVVSTFHDQDPALGSELIELLGGQERMLELIRERETWLLDLEIRDTPDGPIGRARILHLDQDMQGEPRERSVQLARTLVRLLRVIAHPDVEAVLPGGHQILHDGRSMAHSLLRREYDHNQTAIAWNQARNAIAAAIIGEPDTVRLRAAEPILAQLAEWLRQLIVRWVRTGTSENDPVLYAKAVVLDEAGYALPPTRRDIDVDVGAINRTIKTSSVDPVMTVITDLTGLFLRLRNVDNPAGLAIHLRDHVVRYVNLSMDEPWHLTGQRERAVGNLTELGKLVGHLIEILMALAADPSAIGAIRRAGSQGGAQALVRATETAKRVQGAALDRRCQVIADAVAPAVPGCEVEVRGEEQDGFTRFVVAIETTSLFGYILEQQDAVSTAIHSLNRTLDQFTAVPTRAGQRFIDVGIQVIVNPSAAMNTDGWEHLLPEVHPHGLNVTVRAALDGLLALSGISDLREDRQNHPDVVAFAEATVERVQETLEQLAGSGDELAEAIVVDLLEIVGRVNDELDGRAPGETYASAIAGALNGDPTPEMELVGRMHLCSLLWPVDPAEVKAFLGWTPSRMAPVAPPGDDSPADDD